MWFAPKLPKVYAGKTFWRGYLGDLPEQKSIPVQSSIKKAEAKFAGDNPWLITTQIVRRDPGVWTKSPPDNIPPGYYPRPDIIPARTLSPLVAKFCAKIFMDPDIAFYHDARCVMWPLFYVILQHGVEAI